MSGLKVGKYDVPDIVITSLIGALGVGLLYWLAKRAVTATVDVVTEAYSPGGVAYTFGETVGDYLIPDALAGYEGASLGTALFDLVDYFKGTDYTSATYPTVKGPNNTSGQKLPDSITASYNPMNRVY